MTDNEKYCSCGMAEPEIDRHFDICAAREIQRLRADINMLMQSRTDALHTAERLRAALEEIAFQGMDVAPAVGPPSDDYYKNIAYGLIGTAARALKGDSDD